MCLNTDQLSIPPITKKLIVTHSTQLVTDATAVLAFLQTMDWIIDDLATMSRSCCVVLKAGKDLEFEQAETESPLQTVAFR